MKVGDLVRFRQQPDPAIGVVVEVDNITNRARGSRNVSIAWDFLNGQIGWQTQAEVEVISESR